MISRIIHRNGHRMFEIDGVTYEPAAFRSFRPTPANVSLFHRAGVKLYQMQISGKINALGVPYSTYGGAWLDDETYDFGALDRQMQMFQRFAPDGYFMVMILLDTPDWWVKKYPNDVDSYHYLGEACLNRRWRDCAEKYLRAAIRYIEAHYGDRVFAYSYSAGCATEWFDNTAFYAPSERKLSAYRAWAGDPALEAPTRDEAMSAQNPVLREPDEKTARYYRFCASLIPELIQSFAKAAQEEIRHKKLLGLFFGYTDCPDGGFQSRAATNGYESVWKDENIDMFFSPSGYGECRRLNGACSYQYLVDSHALNGKLYLHEIDYRTHLADYPRENGAFIGECAKDEREAVTILRRELCAALVKDAALWWFDFLGGYYAAPAYESELAREMEIIRRVGERPHASVSQIAAFADPMSFLLMKEESGLTMESARYNRNSLHECGAPYDYFNLNDLPRAPLSQYKMLVFLNPVEMGEDARAAIDALPDTVTRVWVHAPGYVRGGRAALENVTRAVGMKLREIDGDKKQPIDYKGVSFGFSRPVAPMFAAADEDMRVLARYADGSAAVAQKGPNVYIGAGNVPRELFHDLALAAGVHLYCHTPGALYADNRFVARQTVHETECEIQFPYECEVEELFDGGVSRTQNGLLRYREAQGRTKLFLIRRKIEA